jgi:hypothetical protein
LSLRRLAFAWSGRHLPVMSDEAWQRWSAGATELARDRAGFRTLRSADGAHAIKELGLRRVLSSAVLRPYAVRFAVNAAELLRRGIGAPEVVGLWRRRDGSAHVVAYRWREGREVRAVAASGGDALCESFGRFLARLHAAGAEFRSGHLGNVLVEPAGTFALIDCVDVRWPGRPVSLAERAAALARCAEDEAVVRAHGAALLRGYLDEARLPAAEASALRARAELAPFRSTT